MRTREHFLLGTEQATLSVTARQELNRQDLFIHAVEAILARYQEEFGQPALHEFIKQLKSQDLKPGDWRIRPEDSCWNQV